MTTIAELTRQYVRLPPYHVSHLQHLVAEWELLADLYYADLLLYVPRDSSAESFVVVAHQRPTNSETTHREDPVGQVRTADECGWVSKAWRSGEIVGGDLVPPASAEPMSVQAVPVRCDGQMIAVLSRERFQRSARRPGPLESAYADAGFELTRMIAEGTYPYRTGGPVLTETIRAGDGLIRLDAEGRIRYVSPNALSGLHRLDVYQSLEGRTLRELGLGDAAIRTAVATSVPASDELEFGDVSVLLLALPLLRKGRSTGCLVLIRDVSEIRRRDRLLLSKEAAIREIHHRVKNNLQTIASLLNLQARRTESAEAASALRESVRRIHSIALVHELLSREASGWVPFNSILQPLLRDVEDGLVADAKVGFVIDGDAGDLPAEVATPLAVVLTELLQNAVEHAFGDDVAMPEGGGQVRVVVCRDAAEVAVAVEDNGAGFADGFDLERDGGLGLRIVRTLVAGELSGAIDLGAAPGSGGARVTLRFPLASAPSADERAAQASLGLVVGDDYSGEAESAVTEAGEDLSPDA